MLPRAETTVSRSSSDPEFVVNTEKHVSEVLGGVLGGFWGGSGGFWEVPLLADNAKAPRGAAPTVSDPKARPLLKSGGRCRSGC